MRRENDEKTTEKREYKKPQLDTFNLSAKTAAAAAGANDGGGSS